MLPTASTLPAPLSAVLPALPKSWSALTWQQLMDCWQCKMRYGGNGDVAQVAAMLALCGLDVAGRDGYSDTTGEAVYTLKDKDGGLWTVTARELSQAAEQTMKWFHYPYGDPGKEAVKDEKGKVVEEAVPPVHGYVNSEWRDAMQLPEETVVVCGDRMMTGTEWQGMTEKERSTLNVLHFQLPAVALYNLTWQQYRTLQALAPQLFKDGVSDDDVLDMQAQFLAHSLVPARQAGSTADPFAPKHDFTYDTDRAEQTVQFWRKTLPPAPPCMEGSGYLQRLFHRLTSRQRYILPSIQGGAGGGSVGSVLFSICFQVYQTALSYYAQAFPLLFNDSSKSDPLQDALTGETKTLNAIMKYQGYTKPEDVYAENLPVILSTLNTMAEEAKQIEQMNARIKSKR